MAQGSGAERVDNKDGEANEEDQTTVLRYLQTSEVEETSRAEEKHATTTKKQVPGVLKGIMCTCNK